MAVVLAPHRGVLRVLRGSALATVNAVLAIAAHTAGGGGTPDGALTVVLTLGVAAAGTALADRRRGLLALLGAVTVTQVVLHLLLDALGRHHSAPEQVSSGPALLLAHAAAVWVSAGLLAGADSALFAAAGALRRIVGALPLRPPAPLATDRRPRLVPPAAPIPTALRQMLRRVTPHRGPPVVS